MTSIVVYSQAISKLVAEGLSTNLMDLANSLDRIAPRWDAYITQDRYSDEAEKALLDEAIMKKMHHDTGVLFNFQREVAATCTRIGVKPVKTHVLTEAAFFFTSGVLSSVNVTSAVLAGVRVVRQAKATARNTSVHAGSMIAKHGLKTLTSDEKLAAKLPGGLVMKLEEIKGGWTPSGKRAAAEPLGDKSTEKKQQKKAKKAASVAPAGFKKQARTVAAGADSDSGSASDSD